jgi:hypothetical protein
MIRATLKNKTDQQFPILVPSYVAPLKEECFTRDSRGTQVTAHLKLNMVIIN